MHFTIDDVSIAYETNGPRIGLPILFIHGFPFSKEMWQPQVDALKKEYYVITYDVRGHGASNIGDGQYTLEYFVDDLIMLLDHLKISKIVAVGLSMGGYIALRAFERHPEKFRGLVLCDTRSEADNNEGKIKRAAQARSVKTNGIGPFADNFLKAVFYEKTFQTNPEVVKFIRDAILKTSTLAIVGTLIALGARTDTTASLYNINIPTLLLVGQYDKLTPPSASKAMQEKIPISELHIIPEAGHLSNLENPSKFNFHLLTFLRKVKGEG